jgi:hypothetical protein
MLSLLQNIFSTECFQQAVQRNSRPGDGNIEAPIHGVVTEQYIDYNRRDVQATGELGIKLLQEYYRNPINLQVTKAYSPASIGKAYLRAMGIKPILQRQPDFPKHLLSTRKPHFTGDARTLTSGN